MEDPSEGCYCAQVQACPHWIATKMDMRLASAKEHSHARAKTFEQELLQEDHRPVVSELQRELRIAMLEIEKLAKTSRDLAKINQELEESRQLAVSDQVRTAKRLMLVSSQLEYTEQQLFSLTSEVDNGQKDSELLRVERIRRETLQEREDAGRLKIETLQEELQEAQKSEQALQQKFMAIQNKYETLSKRHDNLKRQQQELELARESKEALAWLKETTERLCSPPQGSLGHAIHLERSSHASAAVSIHQSSPSSSPPYPSSFIDPPLAAQNQLISLIKELATTNSTLRSELNEYRDLLQDTRNEMLALRSQVEDYEQGHAFANCCGGRMDDGESFRTSRSAWSTLDIPIGGGLDAVSNIGTLGSVPGSPPPFLITPKASKHHRRHLHVSGVRGNVFGELERSYSQSHQESSTLQSSMRHGRDHASNKRADRLTTDYGHHDLSDSNFGAAISASTSISDNRRGSASALSRSPFNAKSTKLYDQQGREVSSPTSIISKPLFTGGGSDTDEGREHGKELSPFNPSGQADIFSESSLPTMSTGMPAHSNRQSLTLLPAANVDNTTLKSTCEAALSRQEENESFELNSGDDSDGGQDSLIKSRSSPISLLSAELQKATRSELKTDEGMLREHDVHPLMKTSSASDLVVFLDGSTNGFSNTNIWNEPAINQHEKSTSEQDPTDIRQRRRLSEPLGHLTSSNSVPAKKSRPSSIYSLRKPLPRMDSPSLHCIHSPYLTSASMGCMPELQRCKSAEVVEQMIVEQRHRTMEAWRVGVVAAAVTQQQSIHSIVAFGEHRKDMDNISIRSKASRRRAKGLAINEPSTKESEEGAVKVDTNDAATSMGHSLPSKDSESTIKGNDLHEGRTTMDGTGSAISTADKFERGVAIDTTETNIAVELSDVIKSHQEKTSKNKKRQSVRSMRSIRSSLLRSAILRSPRHARDRRSASEASAASEPFDRRYDYEHSPYQLLHTLSADLLERLARSDTRELNRRLRRTFDIQALSQMSNSVIDNVLTDVSNLGERFRWLEEQVADPIDEMLEHQPANALSDSEDDSESELDDLDEDLLDDQGGDEAWSFSVEEFFPLAHTVQEMLSEIGKLRMTINELQLSYVQKVEQDRIKAEKDFLQDESSDEDDSYDHTSRFESRSTRVLEKPKQVKNVLGMLDRPRILGSASTGVSGFFNKVFGGSNQSAFDDTTTSGATKPIAVAVEQADKDKPSISKSKSRIVVAETSRIIADSPWMSSPGNPLESKATSQASNNNTPRRSGTMSVAVPGSRLSATTSLAVMASMSPARSSTVHVSEGLTVAQMISSSRTRPIDISFSTDTKTNSLIATSTSALSAQGMLSRSFPRNQSDQSTGLSSLDNDIESKSTSSQTPVAASYQSSSNMSEGVKTPHTPTATKSPDLDSGSVMTKTPSVAQCSITLNKTPRSIGISTRTGGPALSVVTKQDIFQEHWSLSTPSSFSATISTVPSKPTSERQNSVDGLSEGNNATDPQRGGSSMASLSSNSGSEIIPAVAPRLISKPSLITRAGLTVATPSTSTVSSPVSSASWFDNRRFSGTQGTDTTSGGEHRSSESSTNLAALASGGTSVDPQQPRKPRLTTSFHADAAMGGSSESTRSLGRAGGRESALAFLRGDVQVSSILGSLFQQSQAQSLSPAQGQPHPISSSLQRSNSLSIKISKADNSTESSRTSADIMAHSLVHSGRTEGQDGQQDESDTHESTGPPTSSRSDLSTNGVVGQMSTPVTSLSQRAGATSTAVAYVVATPDGHTSDDKDRKKRAVFDRDMIKASQKRILDGIPHQSKPFVPEARPQRARALSVDSAQSTEPLKANEIMDLWRAGAGVSRDIWRGLIKKVDGRE
ncbi:hypothetical protein BGZ76_010806 [Entomortierella beljakovae]|nr:hypothetical protein BGZ76_010806 [Entomortierella beljakovae]